MSILIAQGLAMVDRVITRHSDRFPQPLLTVREAANNLQVSKSFVYNLLSSGQLASVKMGTALRVRPEDLHSYIHRNLINGGGRGNYNE